MEVAWKYDERMLTIFDVELICKVEPRTVYKSTNDYTFEQVGT